MVRLSEKGKRGHGFEGVSRSILSGRDAVVWNASGKRERKGSGSGLSKRFHSALIADLDVSVGDARPMRFVVADGTNPVRANLPFHSVEAKTGRSGMRRTPRFSGCLGCRAGRAGAIRPGRHPFWFSFWPKRGAPEAASPEFPQSADPRVWRIATLTLVRCPSFGRGPNGFFSSAKNSRRPRRRSARGLILGKMRIACRPRLPVRGAKVQAPEIPQSIPRRCGWRERGASAALDPDCGCQTGTE